MHIYMESRIVVLMTLIENRLVDTRTQSGKVRVGRIENVALTYIHYHI